MNISSIVLYRLPKQDPSRAAPARVWITAWRASLLLALAARALGSADPAVSWGNKEPNPGLGNAAVPAVPPSGVDQVQVKPLGGHRGPVVWLTISPRGNSALSGSADIPFQPPLLGDRAARGWGVEDGRLRRQIKLETNITAAVLLPNGRLLCGLADGMLQVRDGKNGRVFRQFKMAHGAAVSSLATTADGRRAVSGGHDYMVRYWDVIQGTELASFKTAGVVWGVTMAPDGDIALAAGQDRMVHRYDLTAGNEVELLPPLTGHADRVSSVAISQDALLAVSASHDRTVRVWDLRGGRELRRFAGHEKAVTCVALSPDARLALSGSLDTTARLWRVADMTEEFSTTHGGWVWAVAFAPDGLHAFSGDLAGGLRFWRWRRAIR